MFRWYHKNVKPYERWIFGVILVIIVISFAASGVAFEMGEVIGGDGMSKGDVAMEVAGSKISKAEFEDFIQRWDRADFSPMLSQMRRRKIDLFFAAYQQHMRHTYEGTENFAMQILMSGQGGDRSLVRRLAADIQAVLGAARAEGLRVSDEEIKQHIRETFGGRTGGFNPDEYLQQVKQMGMRDKEYEKSIGELLLLQKYMSMLGEGVAVATEDVLNEYMRTNDRAKAKYAVVEAADFRVKARRRISQQKLARRLEDSKLAYGFRREASGRLEFLFVSAEKARASVAEPTEEELRKYYDEHKSEFELPVYGPNPPEDEEFEHDHDHDHEDHDGAADADPEKPVLPDPHKKFEDCKAEVAIKVKDVKAKAKADEIAAQVNDRIMRMRMSGEKPEFGVLGAEFKIDTGTTAWFEEFEAKVVDDQLGTIEPGQPTMMWGALVRAGINPMVPVKVRTSKGVAFVRLAEKREPESFLPTERLRAKAGGRLTDDAALDLARKEADAVKAEFAKKWSEAYAEKIRQGQSLTEEQQADLRFTIFAEVAAAHGLKLKETQLVTREGQVEGIADSRPFTTTLFMIEEKARGEVQIAHGTAVTYLVQLESRRPPTESGFMAKRRQIEDRLESEKRRKFVLLMLTEFKRDHVKVHIELPAPKLPTDMN